MVIPIVILWLVSSSCGALAQPLPACPALPRPDEVDARAVLAHPAVQHALAEVDSLLENASRALPYEAGLIATVVLDQQTAWTRGYGRRDAGTPHAPPPTGSDLVRVASISKVFTSLLMFLLRDGGVVNMDDTLVTWMPSFSIADPYRTRDEITLRTLSSHTAGLPREFPYPCSAFTSGGGAPPPYSGCNETEVLKHLSQKFLVSPPNTVFHYSNLGFGLLGRALGHAEFGEDPLGYEKAVAKYIFAPLGMANATFAWDSANKQKYAVGVDMDGTPIEQQDGPTCGWGAPAGCVWASADDIARIMKLMFRSTVPAASSVPGHIDGQTMAEFMLPRVLLRDGMEAIGTPMEMQYLGGGREPLQLWAKGKQVELPGFRSSMSVVEELRFGVFTSALITDVEDHTVWTLPALRILGPAVKAAMAELQPKQALPPAYERFLGSYYDGSVNVEVDPQDASRLVLSLGPDATPLALSYEPSLGPDALRARPLAPLDCRHLDDGANLEIVYFSFEVGGGTVMGTQASALEFMGGLYDRRG